jgi:hypothetical protein
MIPHQNFEVVRDFTQSLDLLDTQGKQDAITDAIHKEGGFLNIPQDMPADAVCFVELNLFDICASGYSFDEAIRNWQNIAEKNLRNTLGNDGFVTVYPEMPLPPSKHDEIQNAAKLARQVS